MCVCVACIRNNYNNWRLICISCCLRFHSRFARPPSTYITHESLYHDHCAYILAIPLRDCNPFCHYAFKKISEFDKIILIKQDGQIDKQKCVCNWLTLIDLSKLFQQSNQICICVTLVKCSLVIIYASFPLAVAIYVLR